VASKRKKRIINRAANCLSISEQQFKELESSQLTLLLLEEQWQKQQWSLFLELSNLTLIQHPQRQLLSLMICGSALQLDDNDLAKSMLESALHLASDTQETTRFIYEVTQIQMAKALFLNKQEDKALLALQSAWKQFGNLIQPLFYDFLVEQAEQHLVMGESRLAIQTWQDIASIMQEYTPEHVYHRMSHCYAVNTQGFGGSEEENNTFGDYHKHDLLEFFHAQLQPEFYFEIGVDRGLSLARAQGKALGVDARPKLNLLVSLPSTTRILGMSSDAFFRDCAEKELKVEPDLAFIDGMHLFEFALRDFMNLEKYAAPYTLVGIDDIFPCHIIQAERRRQSSAWTGDVWKIIPVLEKYRPDLTLITLRCSTTGLLLISGLNPENRALEDHYDEIVTEYQADLPLPDKYLQRTDSIASDHSVVDVLMSILRHIKTKKYDFKQACMWLAKLHPIIDLAKQDLVLSRLKKTDEVRTTLMLYWKMAESGYNENDAVKRSYELNGEKVSFSLPLPNAEINIECLRLDIAQCQGCFFVKELCLFDSADEILWSWNLRMNFFKNIGQLESFAMPERNQICLISTGTDPQFELDLPPELVEKANGGKVLITFTPMEFKE
jgi:hypothetical protein